MSLSSRWPGAGSSGSRSVSPSASAIDSDTPPTAWSALVCAVSSAHPASCRSPSVRPLGVVAGDAVHALEEQRVVRHQQLRAPRGRLLRHRQRRVDGEEDPGDLLLRVAGHQARRRPRSPRWRAGTSRAAGRRARSAWARREARPRGSGGCPGDGPACAPDPPRARDRGGPGLLRGLHRARGPRGRREHRRRPRPAVADGARLALELAAVRRRRPVRHGLGGRHHRHRAAEPGPARAGRAAGWRGVRRADRAPRRRGPRARTGRG